MPSGPPGPLEAALRGDEDKQQWVNWLFSHVAPRYDLGNDLMSMGWHTRWKRRLVQYVDVQPTDRVLDLACGTGDVTLMLSPLAGQVVGSDINPEMVEVARSKQTTEDNIQWVLNDAAALPFADASFDKVTCVYAGRGFPDWPAVVREVHRVLRPGGHFWNLDFARPANQWWDRTYRGYMMVSGAALGLALHGNPQSYMYIPASMYHYKGQRWLEAELKQAGFQTETLETFATLMAFNHGIKAE